MTLGVLAGELDSFSFIMEFKRSCDEIGTAFKRSFEESWPPNSGDIMPCGLNNDGRGGTTFEEVLNIETLNDVDD